jgi:hypothetical protein
MTYKCPRCSTAKKDWSGDDRKCGFSEKGNFLEDNWMCATLIALREMGEEGRVWCDEQNMTIIARDDVGHGILSWYKSRGATDDFRNGWFEKGTLRFAQELLEDIEPSCYDMWENIDLGDDEE